MDSEIPWDDCVADDIHLDTSALPPLNDLTSTSSHLPHIDLLDLFSFDPHSPDTSRSHSNVTASVSVSVSTPTLTPTPASPPPSSSSTDVASLSDSDSDLVAAKPPANNNNNLTSHSSSSSTSTVVKQCKPSKKNNNNNNTLNSSSSSPSLSPKSSSNKTLTHTQKKQKINKNTTSTSSPSPTHSTSDHLQTHSNSNSHSNSHSNSNSNSNSNSHSHSHTHHQQQQPQLADQAQLVLELSTRLASAGAETTALRKRVAALSSENRSLRAALDQANARLIAVAQAASATTTTPTASQHQQQPVMLGLAHITSDVAQRLSGAFTISDPHVQQHPPVHHHQPARKKRKRVSGAAATTMACVMFMWGALVGSPAWLSNAGSASRSQAALPGVGWGKDPATGGNPSAKTGGAAGAGAAAPVPATGRSGGGGGGGGSASEVSVGPASAGASTWQPNCMRLLEQLPDGSGTRLKKEPKLMALGNDKMDIDDDDDDNDDDHVDNVYSSAVVKKQESIPMTVALDDKKLVARLDDSNILLPRSNTQATVPRYSYVLCRDAHAAVDNVKACADKMKNGMPCGEPHTISLILPAAAAGLVADDGGNDTDSAGHLDLAEVQCSVTAVARIPKPKRAAAREGDGVVKKEEGEVAQGFHRDSALYGKIIAAVPETGTIIADA